MQPKKQLYRKNFLLVVLFIILISITLLVTLGLGYNLTKKYVENEFSSAKIEVQEATIKPYNDFFQNTIPEISFYQGFLDSASVVKYVDTVFRKYGFVNKIIFYDTQISNHRIADGFRVNRFSMGPKLVLQFNKKDKAKYSVVFTSAKPNTLSLKTADEFNKMAIRFSGFIESVDTTKSLSNDQIFNTFYSIAPDRITYMNIPRLEELKIYKDLMFNTKPNSPFYEQDILTFYTDPTTLKIYNNHPELYQKISIKPLVYESLDTNPDLLTTDIALPGAFADYKLYFTSSRIYLNAEINRRFLPIALALLLIYGVLVIIANLIYRNLNINAKMFSLQYDFINNLTHEFKTPVSVIKIAGNNIKSAQVLSDTERKHYGRILDEEADKLNDLMNKLLSFTQIENKSIKLKLETINMDVFIQNLVDTYQMKYPTLEVNLQLHDITHFKTDPILLSSVFSNLIDNAYKYSPTDRKFLEITVERNKKDTVFTFRDTGIGIPLDELKNVFKKFYRIQSQYNQQGSVGLGLAFCKELVNFMKGEISVQSVLNQGSTFTIILPNEI